METALTIAPRLRSASTVSASVLPAISELLWEFALLKRPDLESALLDLFTCSENACLRPFVATMSTGAEVDALALMDTIVSMECVLPFSPPSFAQSTPAQTELTAFANLDFSL